LPATSTSLAVRLCAPIANGFPVVNDQVPPAATLALPIAVLPSRTVTMSPASPRHAILNVSPLAALSAPTAKLSPEDTGAEVLIVSLSAAADAALVPSAPLSVAVRVCTPAASARSPAKLASRVRLEIAVACPDASLIRHIAAALMPTGP
jgi:hypothetical protein